MRKVVLGVALSLSITSMASSAQQASTTIEGLNATCADFTSVLANEASNQASTMLVTVAQLINNCPTVTDQIVEAAISLTQPTEHQDILQAAADTGVIAPADALLAAIAGGGDPATLSEPTAGGNLTIVPASAATAPPGIGGLNGGAGPVASGN